jgi:hypothetical protein
MKLYLVKQNLKNDFDTFDSLIVSALSEKDARTIPPDEFPSSAWIDSSQIHLLEVEYLGETTKKRGVILSSFNAG